MKIVSIYGGDAWGLQIGTGSKFWSGVSGWEEFLLVANDLGNVFVCIFHKEISEAMRL